MEKLSYNDKLCMVWFTQNGWGRAVDSTADFLNSAQLSLFVRV